jgi:hypothetical protein
MRTLGHVLHRGAVHDAIGARLVGVVGVVSPIGFADGIVVGGLLHSRPLDDIFLELAVVLLQDSDPVRLGLG